MPQALMFIPNLIGYGAAYASAAAGVSIAAATAIGTFFTNAAVAIMTNSVLRALAPKVPKPQPSPRTQSIADTRAPAKLLFGTVNVAGTHVLPPIVTSGTAVDGTVYPGVWTHRNHALAAHEVDGFGPVYVEQMLIPDHTITGPSNGLNSGRVTGGSTPYDSSASERRLMIRRYTGTGTQTVDPILNYVDSAAFDSNFRLRGIAYASTTGAYDAAFPSGYPPISFVVHGAKCYDPRKDSTNGGTGAHRYTDSSTWEWTNNPPLCASTLAMLSKLIGGGAVDPSTDINWSTVAAAATVCDTLVEGASQFQNFVSDGNADMTDNVITKTGGTNGAWDASIRSTDGMTKGTVCAGRYDLTSSAMFGIGVDPTVSASYASIDYAIHFDSTGIHLYESGTFISTVSASVAATDWGRIDYDGARVLYWVNGKIVRAVNVPSPGVAYYFDSSLLNTDDGLLYTYQPRYQCNLELECTALVDENIATIMDCCLGRTIEQGGVYQFFAGAWDTPTFTINHTDWIGPVSIQAVPPRLEGRWNGVRCWYYDPLRNWQRVESYPRTNDIYKAQDGDERIWSEIDQPGCNLEDEAQRKAEFILRQSRNGIKVTGRLGPKFQHLGMWETGIVVWPVLGWTTKTFRIASYSPNPDGSVDVGLSEEQEADWADLDTNDNSIPSAVPLPNANETTPGTPTSLSIVRNIAGTLLFSWGEPLIRPEGMRYQLIRSVSSRDASVGTVVWEGLSRSALLFMPTSAHWYHVRAITNSAYSGYYPNTFGLEGVPRDESTQEPGYDAISDPQFDKSARMGDFWTNERGPYFLPNSSFVWSLETSGGLIGGKAVCRVSVRSQYTTGDAYLLSVPSSPLPQNYNTGYSIGMRARMTSYSHVTTHQGNVLIMVAVPWNGATPLLPNTPTSGPLVSDANVGNPLASIGITNFEMTGSAGELLNQWVTKTVVGSTSNYASDVSSYPYVIAAMLPSVNSPGLQNFVYEVDRVWFVRY